MLHILIWLAKKEAVTYKCLLLILLLVNLNITLTACESDTAKSETTATSQVVVARPTETIPTVTPQSTNTPLPTLTPTPSLTPTPTNTPTPTWTPSPTGTPLPTNTAEPTNTPTSAPTNTFTPVPIISSPVPATPSIDNQSLLLDALNVALVEIDTYIAQLNITSGYPYNPIAKVDCPILVASYDRMANVLIIDVSEDTSVVQNAYALYQTAITQYVEIGSELVEECRESIINEVTILVIASARRGALTTMLEEPRNLLNQARNSLTEP